MFYINQIMKNFYGLRKIFLIILILCLIFKYYYISMLNIETDEAEIKRKDVSTESLGWWNLSDNSFANGPRRA